MAEPEGDEGVGRMVVPTVRPPSEEERYGWKPPSKITMEAKTARTLAIVLVSMLGGSLLLHEGLVVLMTFHNKPEAIPILEHTFNQWLPVMAGLVGTAVGFYLKERK